MLKSDAIVRLQRLLARIDNLKPLQEDSPEFEKWSRDTEVAIERIFGEKSRNITDFNNIHFYLSEYASDTPEREFRKAFIEGLDIAGAILQSMIDEIQEYWPEDNPSVASTVNKGVLFMPAIDVFISHSSRDADVAMALIELLRNGCNIPPDKIRCTSIDGYRLKVGANTDEQLRAEVKAAKYFIGLITPASLQSAYVLFELGARWGANLHLAPVLASGVDTSLLKGPLSGLNALTCSSEAQMHQLVNDIVSALEYPQASPAVYDRYLKQLTIVSIKAEKSQNP